MNKVWEQWEIDFLKENYPDYGLIQKRLITRTRRSIHTKAYKLGLSEKVNQGKMLRKLNNSVYTAERIESRNRRAGFRVNQFKNVDLSKFKGLSE